MARATSRSADLADTTITRGGSSYRERRSRTPQPSITGIITSRSITSKRPSPTRSSAVSPSAARAVSNPSASMLMRNIRRMSGSSSTMRTRVTALPYETDVALPGDHLAHPHGLVPVRAQDVLGLVGVGRRHHGDHADAEVEDTLHLVVGD